MNQLRPNTTSTPVSNTKPPYFADKKVLITGASSGVGMALAYWYLNNGAQVALIGRDIETLTSIGAQFPS
jgi:NADP-dependent 3-hydroxy acid dehydrogenase YdfG